jgi:hypothetical protein
MLLLLRVLFIAEPHCIDPISDLDGLQVVHQNHDGHVLPKPILDMDYNYHLHCLSGLPWTSWHVHKVARHWQEAHRIWWFGHWVLSLYLNALVLLDRSIRWTLPRESRKRNMPRLLEGIDAAIRLWCCSNLQIALCKHFKSSL